MPNAGTRGLSRHSVRPTFRLTMVSTSPAITRVTRFRSKSDCFGPEHPERACISVRRGTPGAAAESARGHRRAAGQESPGIFNVCPGRITLDFSPFAFRMLAGVVPYRCAIAHSVSDRRTVCRLGAAADARSALRERPVRRDTYATYSSGNTATWK